MRHSERIHISLQLFLEFHMHFGTARQVCNAAIVLLLFHSWSREVVWHLKMCNCIEAELHLHLNYFLKHTLAIYCNSTVAEISALFCFH